MRVFRTPAPRPLLPKVKGPITKLKDIKTLELCRQLTLTEYKMFSKIQPQELCEAAWTKADKETAAPNLLRIARRFNNVDPLPSLPTSYLTSFGTRKDGMVDGYRSCINKQTVKEGRGSAKVYRSCCGKTRASVLQATIANNTKL